MKRIKQLLSGKRWLVIKTIMINWAIFTLLIVGYAARQFYFHHQVTEAQLDQCQKVMNQWEAQIKSGRIILELYGEEK